jgi:hypothetical protein
MLINYEAEFKGLRMLITVSKTSKSTLGPTAWGRTMDMMEKGRESTR